MVTDETYWLEGCDVTDTIVWRDVVYCHASPLNEACIGVLLNALVCPVLCVEVKSCSPVVAFQR